MKEVIYLYYIYIKTGKSQTIEGNRKEAGLISLVSDALFTILEDKKLHTN